VSEITRSTDQNREALSLLIERHFPSSTLSDTLHLGWFAKQFILFLL
jgi:hypothetical protein